MEEKRVREARANAREAHGDLACPASSPTQQALSSEAHSPPPRGFPPISKACCLQSSCTPAPEPLQEAA